MYSRDSTIVVTCLISDREETLLDVAFVSLSSACLLLTKGVDWVCPAGAEADLLPSDDSSAPILPSSVSGVAFSLATRALEAALALPSLRHTEL